MSHENLENTHRLFKAVEERDVVGVLAAYDPEIVIRDAELLPYGGIYHGLEGAKQHIEGAAQTGIPLNPPQPSEKWILSFWRWSITR